LSTTFFVPKHKIKSPKSTLFIQINSWLFSQPNQKSSFLHTHARRINKSFSTAKSSSNPIFFSTSSSTSTSFIVQLLQLKTGMMVKERNNTVKSETYKGTLLVHLLLFISCWTAVRCWRTSGSLSIRTFRWRRT